MHRWCEVLASWLALIDDNYVNELRQAMVHHREIKQSEMSAPVASRSARLFYYLQQSLQKFERGMELVRSTSMRQAQAACGYEAIAVRDEALKLPARARAYKRPLDVVRFLEDELGKVDQKLHRFPELKPGASDRLTVLLQSVNPECRHYVVLHGKSGTWEELVTSIRFFEEQTRLCDAGALHAVGEKGLCWNCGKAGHYSWQCPDPPKGGKGKGKDKGKGGKPSGGGRGGEPKGKGKGGKKGEKGKDKGKPKAKPKAKSKGRAVEDEPSEQVMALRFHRLRGMRPGKAVKNEPNDAEPPRLTMTDKEVEKLNQSSSRNSHFAWLVDSGATCHVLSVASLGFYEVVKEHSGPLPVLMSASDTEMECLGLVDIRVKFGKLGPVVLQKVLVCQIGFNVISSWQASLSGWCSWFTATPGESCLMKYNGKGSWFWVPLETEARSWWAMAQEIGPPRAKAKAKSKAGVPKGTSPKFGKEDDDTGDAMEVDRAKEKAHPSKHPQRALEVAAETKVDRQPGQMLVMEERWKDLREMAGAAASRRGALVEKLRLSRSVEQRREQEESVAMNRHDPNEMVFRGFHALTPPALPTTAGQSNAKGAVCWAHGPDTASTADGCANGPSTTSTAVCWEDAHVPASAAAGVHGTSTASTTARIPRHFQSVEHRAVAPGVRIRGPVRYAHHSWCVGCASHSTATTFSETLNKAVKSTTAHGKGNSSPDAKEEESITFDLMRFQECSAKAVGGLECSAEAALSEMGLNGLDIVVHGLEERVGGQLPLGRAKHASGTPKGFYGKRLVRAIYVGPHGANGSGIRVFVPLGDGKPPRLEIFSSFRARDPVEFDKAVLDQLKGNREDPERPIKFDVPLDAPQPPPDPPALPDGSLEFPVGQSEEPGAPDAMEDEDDVEMSDGEDNIMEDGLTWLYEYGLRQLYDGPDLRVTQKLRRVVRWVMALPEYLQSFSAFGWVDPSFESETLLSGYVDASWNVCSVSGAIVLWHGMMIKCLPAGDTGSYPIYLSSDSEAALSISKMKGLLRRVRHLELRHRYLQELVQSERLRLTFIQGCLNPSDGLTKSPEEAMLQHLLEACGLERICEEDLQTLCAPDHLRERVEELENLNEKLEELPENLLKYRPVAVDLAIGVVPLLVVELFCARDSALCAACKRESVAYIGITQEEDFLRKLLQNHCQDVLLTQEWPKTCGLWKEETYQRVKKPTQGSDASQDVQALHRLWLRIVGVDGPKQGTTQDPQWGPSVRVWRSPAAAQQPEPKTPRPPRQNQAQRALTTIWESLPEHARQQIEEAGWRPKIPQPPPGLFRQTKGGAGKGKGAVGTAEVRDEAAQAEAARSLFASVSEEQRELLCKLGIQEPEVQPPDLASLCKQHIRALPADIQKLLEDPPERPPTPQEVMSETSKKFKIATAELRDLIFRKAALQVRLDKHKELYSNMLSDMKSINESLEERQKLVATLQGELQSSVAGAPAPEALPEATEALAKQVEAMDVDQLDDYRESHEQGKPRSRSRGRGTQQGSDFVEEFLGVDRGRLACAFQPALLLDHGLTCAPASRSQTCVSFGESVQGLPLSDKSVLHRPQFCPQTIFRVCQMPPGGSLVLYPELEGRIGAKLWRPRACRTFASARGNGTLSVLTARRGILTVETRRCVTIVDRGPYVPLTPPNQSVVLCITAKSRKWQARLLRALTIWCRASILIVSTASLLPSPCPEQLGEVWLGSQVQDFFQLRPWRERRNRASVVLPHVMQKLTAGDPLNCDIRVTAVQAQVPPKAPTSSLTEDGGAAA
ncbi:GIP [Symbiodinium sp. CCMP2592]|nr:GIP [Symbiodinium sp. CCMP2592]